MSLITKEEFKVFASITDDSEDEILQIYIDAAEEFIKNYCNRTFEETVYTNELYDGPGTPCLVVDDYPILSVEEILEYDEVVSSISDLDDDGYYIKNNRPYGIYHSLCWSAGRDTIKVSYTAGYSSIPSDLKLAAFLVTSYFRNMSTKQGIRGESLGSYSYSLSNDVMAMGGRLIIPDVAITNILNRYKKVLITDPM